MPYTGLLLRSVCCRVSEMVAGAVCFARWLKLCLGNQLLESTLLRLGRYTGPTHLTCTKQPRPGIRLPASYVCFASRELPHRGTHSARAHSYYPTNNELYG